MSDESEPSSGSAHCGPLPKRAAEASRWQQPWSDSARRAAAESRQRRTGRARQLSRFNTALAEMIVREIEEEQQVASALHVVLRFVWAPLMFAGGVVVHRVTGTTDYSPRELAMWLSVAVLAGLCIYPLWRLLRGEAKAPVADSNPDGPAEAPSGFTTLGLVRRDDESGR